MKVYKYCLAEQVSAQYTEIFGEKRNVISELNQLLLNATIMSKLPKSTVYHHKKRDLLIEVANDRRVVLSVTKTPSIEMLKTGVRTYEISEHAIDRAIERLGLGKIRRELVAKTIIDRMQTAVFTGEVAKGRVFDHYGSRSRFIVAKDKDIIITTYNMDSIKPTIKLDTSIGRKVINLVDRELRKAGAMYRKRQREIMTVASELKIAIAKDELNIVNAKAPHVKTIIQNKLDENTTKLESLMSQLEKATDDYSAKKAEATRLLGE